MFRKSMELGLPYDHSWIIVKKGGRLITIRSDRYSGDLNLTQKDYVQIVRPDELIKPDEFMQWEQRREDQRYYDRQMQEAFLQQSVQPSVAPQFQPTPNINIRVVAGDDNSRNDGHTQEENGQTVLAGGGQGQGPQPKVDSGFDKLVIPNTKGGSSKEPPSILSGLAQVGTAIINKLG